jgi:hypothetical protein
MDGFPARPQAGILRSLCGDASTARGRYRAMLQVSVDAIGEVSQTTLLDTTGRLS